MKMCESFAKLNLDTTLFALHGPEPCADVFNYYGVMRKFRIVRMANTRGRVAEWSVVRLGVGAFYRALMLGRLRRNGMPDLLYGRDAYLMCLLRGGGVPMIYESHAPPVGIIRKTCEKMLFRSKNFVRLVVISRALQSYYEALFPWIDSKKILVAHDAASVASGEAMSKKNAKLIGRPNAVAVGYVGHLYSGRGIDLIFKMAEVLSDVDFHLVGGAERDIAIWSEKCRLKNVFFYGHVPHGELGSYYRAFDILLAPYQQETTVENKGNTSRWMSPLKVFEYMASGKPMIVSDLPVLREVLEDGVECLLCRPDVVSDWIAAVRRLVSDRNLREQLGATAKDRLEKHYSWDVRAKATLEGIV
jgi:glycosyltransferase involved in cell wall biosynthesis